MRWLKSQNGEQGVKNGGVKPLRNSSFLVLHSDLTKYNYTKTENKSGCSLSS